MRPGGHKFESYDEPYTYVCDRFNRRKSITPIDFHLEPQKHPNKAIVPDLLPRIQDVMKEKFKEFFIDENPANPQAGK